MAALSLDDGAAAPRPDRAAQWRARLLDLAVMAAGIAVLLGLWWLGGRMIAADPRTTAFADFAPGPTFARLQVMVASGEAWAMTWPSLQRIGLGLGYAILIGVPMGILIGALPLLRTATNVPFQFLRMISPLSWMPVAVMVFATWDNAIVFLIAVAAVWPVMFATAAGYRRIDPTWLRVSRNLGARPPHLLFFVIMPAISQDVLTGIRLALGVAWVVLVPAEFLGVTSGLGYAINDARDTLEYDRLAATVVVIGVIGFALDWVCQRAIAHWSWIREP
jgi:NitT/TauT family transport system permease protein